jgi:hypothetical protein
MIKKILLFIPLTIIPFVAGSHIGSPGVSFEGKAGSYEIMVQINPPDVIPGTATVDIFTDGTSITSIWAKPEYWYAGDEGTPEADELLPVKGEAGHYRGLIWLMDAGTSGIEIEIKGNSGNGKVLVPVMAVSTRQKSMDPSLGWTLFGLCALLVILMVTIISVSVSDGMAKPNEPIAGRLKQRKLIGAVVSSVTLLVILWGGKSWWDSWANDYRRFMYRSLKATTSITENRLTFSVDTTRLSNLTFTRNISYIIPDHGKLMHMFLVREGSMDVFAHLHPTRKDSVTFVSSLPRIPPGKYLVFADVTRFSGFAETIPDTFELNKPIDGALDSLQFGKDDTYFFTNPVTQTTPSPGNLQDVMICGKPGVRLPLADGSTITWEHDTANPLRANTLYSLKFSVLDEDGNPALLQPYLGMGGHAVVMKDDGTVYIHLHPVGSYSIASQQTMLTRFENEKGPFDFDKRPKSVAFMDSVDRIIEHLESMTEEARNKILMAGMQHDQFDASHPEHSIVSFPYAFPAPGKYRIWVQMKRNGRVLNSAFDAMVE